MTNKKPTLSLILGGARSGKTAFAEARAEMLAARDGAKPFYLATGQGFDDEMQHRIDRHRAIRGERFETLEEPLDIAAAVKSIPPGRTMLIDSVGTWISNLMFHEKEIDSTFEKTQKALVGITGNMVMVSDEIGLGIVPENAMARQFRDHIGMFNQQVAAMADHVVLVVAGQPLFIKGSEE